jgi:hypothetical protein
MTNKEAAELARRLVDIADACGDRTCAAIIKNAAALIRYTQSEVAKAGRDARRELRELREDGKRKLDEAYKRGLADGYGECSRLVSKMKGMK